MKDEPEVPALQPGEERLLQTVHRLDGNRNDIYLVHRDSSDYTATGAGDRVKFVAIIRSTDEDPTDTSPPWAWKNGPTERSIYIGLAEAVCNAPPLPGVKNDLDPVVQWFVDGINEKYGPEPSAVEVTGQLASQYVAVCDEVLVAANACLAAANRIIASGGVNEGASQSGGSIRDFMSGGQGGGGGEFDRRYAEFDEVCTRARKLASRLLVDNPTRAEMVLVMGFPQEALDQVATAKGILGATFGPSAEAFLQGVATANALMRDPSEDDDSAGNIYRPVG